MKIFVKWTAITIAVAVLSLFLYQEFKFGLFPRSTTEEITGFELPASAEFVEHMGRSNNLYYRWKVSYSDIENLSLPSSRKKVFDLPSDWSPYDGSYFGSLTSDDIAADAESLYYGTSWWDIALIRSRSEGTLIVGAIYTN